MNPTEQAMCHAVEETFASLAFMFPVEADLSPPSQGPMESAAVDFSGPFRGRLLLSASAAMLEPLAANMLGLEEGTCPSEEQKQDAFKELLNVICGNLLPTIASPREVFNVHEPRLLPQGQAQEPPTGLSHAGTVRRVMDCGPIGLTLLLQSQMTIPSAVGQEFRR